jgi:hypothetical protein
VVELRNGLAEKHHLIVVLILIYVERNHATLRGRKSRTDLGHRLHVGVKLSDSGPYFSSSKHLDMLHNKKHVCIPLKEDKDDKLMRFSYLLGRLREPHYESVTSTHSHLQQCVSMGFSPFLYST